MDDAFLGIVARILDIVEQADGANIAKSDIEEASRQEDYPEFRGFVEELFGDADADGDQELNEEEASCQHSGCRQHRRFP